MPETGLATWPKPHDLAQVILFLASDVAKHYAARPFRFMATPDLLGRSN